MKISVPVSFIRRSDGGAIRCLVCGFETEDPRHIAILWCPGCEKAHVQHAVALWSARAGRRWALASFPLFFLNVCFAVDWIFNARPDATPLLAYAGVSANVLGAVLMWETMQNNWKSWLEGRMLWRKLGRRRERTQWTIGA